MIGNEIKISLVLGDIADQHSDAIVYLSNKNLSFDTNEGKSILKKGGNKLV